MRRSRRWIASNIVTATLCVCVRACVCACLRIFSSSGSTLAPQLFAAYITRIYHYNRHTHRHVERHTHTQSIKTIVLLRSHADMIWERC